MTSTLVNWLNSGVTDYYYYAVTKSKEGNPKLLDLFEAYSKSVYIYDVSTTTNAQPSTITNAQPSTLWNRNVSRVNTVVLNMA